MKARCIAAVGSAIGRDLTVSEVRTIEQRIADEMARGVGILAARHTA